MTKQDVMYAQEVADILGVSVNTVQRKEWRMRTGCPLRRVGRILIAMRNEFEKWFRSLHG